MFTTRLSPIGGGFRERIGMGSRNKVRVGRRTSVILIALWSTGIEAAVAQAGPDPSPKPAPPASSLTKEIAARNDRALALYQARRPQAAHAELLAALARGNEGGLGATAVMARTQLHLGVVTIAGLDDWLRGMEHFARALAIDPDITLPAALSTRGLKRDLREARRIKLPPAVTPAPAVPPRSETGDGDCWVMPANADEPPLPRPSPQPLYCPTPELGPIGETVPLFCATQSNLGEDAKVLAYYRTTGAVAYTPLAMK
ncbi:MAG TPA: hypothetical protein VGG33_11365, partial [Polyangia bacterium]